MLGIRDKRMKQQTTKDIMIQQTVDLALKMPVKASQQRLAAICVDKKGKVLGRGVNSYTRTHPLQKHFAIVAALPEEKMFLHAELQAVLRSRDKEIHTIYVARVLKDDTISLAKPCKACEQMLKSFGVQKVVYTITKECYCEQNVENL